MEHIEQSESEEAGKQARQNVYSRSGFESLPALSLLTEWIPLFSYHTQAHTHTLTQDCLVCARARACMCFNCYCAVHVGSQQHANKVHRAGTHNPADTQGCGVLTWLHTESLETIKGS